MSRQLVKAVAGMLAYTVENDKRIKEVGIFNSGSFAKDGADAKGGKLMVFTYVTKFTKPIFHFLGKRIN